MKLKMLCTCGPQSSDASPILDVEKVFQDYAWREFRHLTPWLSGVLIRRSDYVIDVQWNFFEFDHVTSKFKPRPSTKEGFTEKKKAELYATDFKNDTGRDQTYNFKIQRQTKATTSVTYQRGYTISGKANFTVKIPAVFGDCGVSAGIDGQLQVTKSNGQVFEEIFNWETDSEVTVEKNHVTVVKMLITEDELFADFEVKTLIKMPSGEAPIFIRRRRDNEIQAVCLITNLSEVFASLEEDHVVDVIRVKLSQNDIRHDIRLTTTGVLRSIRWRDQKISLTSRPLEDTGPVNKPIESHTELSDLRAAEICAHVIKHVTDTTNFETETISDKQTKPKTPSPVANTETRLIKQPTIPTIVTEVPSDNEETIPFKLGSKSLDIVLSDSNEHPRRSSRGGDEKPRLERGKHCEDGNSPQQEVPPKSLLSTLQTRRAKLAKVTSV